MFYSGISKRWNQRTSPSQNGNLCLISVVFIPRQHFVAINGWQSVAFSTIHWAFDVLHLPNDLNNCKWSKLCFGFVFYCTTHRQFSNSSLEKNRALELGKYCCKHWELLFLLWNVPRESENRHFLWEIFWHMFHFFTVALTLWGSILFAKCHTLRVELFYCRFKIFRVTYFEKE